MSGATGIFGGDLTACPDIHHRGGGPKNKIQNTLWNSNASLLLFSF